MAPNVVPFAGAADGCEATCCEAAFAATGALGALAVAETGAGLTAAFACAGAALACAAAAALKRSLVHPSGCSKRAESKMTRIKAPV